MADKTRREVLSEAFDNAENESKSDDEKVVAGANEEKQQQSADTGTSGESESDTKGVDEEKPGKEIEAKGEEKQKKEDKKVEEETPDQKEAKAAQKETERTREAVKGTDKPPNSWKPAAREDWGKIPPSARAEIGRRELEIQRELSQTATIRRFSNDLAKVIQPHLPVIQAQNTNPLAAIDTLMKTASSLYQGNQEQKSRIVAQIIQDYGVDVRILDKVLSQQPIPPDLTRQNGGTNPNAVPPWAQPIFNFMTQTEAARQQREMDMTNEATAEIEQASQNMPYLDDLRDEVADILEVAARRNKVVTLEEAYNRAVALDPEISKIVNQRKIAADQKKKADDEKLARAKKAAITIKGNPTGGAAGGSKGGKLSRRDILEQAWEDQAT